MNTTLNLKRVGLLINRFFTENKKVQLIFFSFLVLLFATLNNFAVSMTPFIVIIIGNSYINQQYGFNLPANGMQYLLIPATHAEKITAGIIIGSFYSFALILLAYIIGNFIGISVSNLLSGTSNPISWKLFYSINSHNSVVKYEWSNSKILVIFTLFLVFQAVEMVSIFSNKRYMQGRGILVALAVILALAVIQWMLSVFMYGSFSHGSFLIKQAFKHHIEITNTIKDISKIGVVLLIPFLWLVSYFRLTEKQL